MLPVADVICSPNKLFSTNDDGGAEAIHTLHDGYGRGTSCTNKSIDFRVDDVGT